MLGAGGIRRSKPDMWCGPMLGGISFSRLLFLNFEYDCQRRRQQGFESVQAVCGAETQGMSVR